MMILCHSDEVWRDIPNFQGYQVSDLGRVRTFNKVSFTNKHGKRCWKNRILKFKGQDSKKVYKTGYRVDLWKDGKPNTFLVARLVAFTFYNEDINNHKLTVDHLDGNRLNNNLKNLELVSLKENIKRGFENGLYHKQKRINLTNKKTNETTSCSSMNKANDFMKKNHSYLFNKIKKGIYEDENYKWEVAL